MEINTKVVSTTRSLVYRKLAKQTRKEASSVDVGALQHCWWEKGGQWARAEFSSDSLEIEDNP